MISKHGVEGQEETAYVSQDLTIRDGRYLTQHVYAGGRSSLAVSGVDVLPGVQRVFSLEVESEHEYLASELRVLSHNTQPVGEVQRGRRADRRCRISGHTCGATRGSGCVPESERTAPRNAPTTLYGRELSGRALDRMQERGFTPSVVQNAIEHGVATPQAGRGTIIYWGTVNKLIVSVDAATGRVVTVF